MEFSASIRLRMFMNVNVIAYNMTINHCPNVIFYYQIITR